MYVIKVLKRRDAASVIVAIWIAMSLNQLLFIPTYRLSNWITGLGDKNFTGYGGPAGWRNEYLSPIVTFTVQVIALEILLRLIVWVRPMFVRKAK